MINGNRIKALFILLFIVITAISITVISSCQANKNAAATYSEQLNVQDKEQGSKDDSSDMPEDVPEDEKYEMSEYDSDSAFEASDLIQRFFKVTKDKDNQYVLILYDSDRKVVKEEKFPITPVISILDDKIIEVKISLSPLDYVYFYDTKTGNVSTVYIAPFAVSKDKVAYMKDGVLIVTNMFDKSLFYKEIRRNFARTAVFSTAISEANFQEPDILAIKYLEGIDFKVTTELINLSGSEDEFNMATDPSMISNSTDTLVLVQNEPINKEKLKRDNTVEADFLEIKEFNRIADFKTADVNGDKIQDTIIAISQDKKPVSINAISARNFVIILQDGETKNISLLDNSFTNDLVGVDLSLLTGNFDDDMVSDLLIYVNTGGNGGHRVITFKGNKPLAILGESRDSMRIDAKGEFVDGYKFLIRYDPINYQYAIDVSSKKEKYKELYSDGRIKVQQPYSSGTIDSFYELIPKDTDDDGVLEILGSQIIFGSSRSDTMGTLRSLLKWDDVLKEYKVLKLFYIEDLTWDEDWYEIN